VKVLAVKDRAGDGRNLRWHCPGCGVSHMVTVAGVDGHAPTAGPVWTWDGNVDRPTIGPSVKITGGPQGNEYVCHLYVNEGRIQFLGDSTHRLAGQTVDMVPLEEASE
jgi:hypothetical protein